MTRPCLEHIPFGEAPLRTNSNVSFLIRSSRPQATGNQRRFSLHRSGNDFIFPYCGSSKPWRSGGREGGQGEREREHPLKIKILSSKPLDKHSTFRQNHSTSTAHQSIDTTSKKLMTEVCNRKVYRSRMDPLDIVSVY